jgi:hypothetical protein
VMLPSALEFVDRRVGRTRAKPGAGEERAAADSKTEGSNTEGSAR